MDAGRYYPQVEKDLGLEKGKVAEAVGRRNVTLIEDYSVPYLRFTKEVGKAEAGTVAFLTDKLQYIRGFPKIRRAMFLKSSLKKHFKDKVQAEEKMDGYNVRVASVDGKIVAVTRGGLVCTYTTERIREELGRNAFFEDNPGLMLCGEVVGLMNPYQMKSYPEARDFGYFVFDIRDRRTGEARETKERAKLIDKYKLPSVKNFGVFSTKDGEKLLKLVRQLGKDRREGLVLKDPAMKTQVKYTANQSTNSDLRYAFKFFFDYGQPFFFRRLIREAFQTYELGLTGAELDKEASDLGRSMLIPMVDTIRKIAEGKEVTEDFEIKVPSLDFGSEFIKHLQHLGVRATLERISEGPEDIVIRIKRHYPSTNDRIKAYLQGEFCQD